jgi:hypothetical protein
MKETTEMRGRWDRRDSILHRSADGIFFADDQNAPTRLGEKDAIDPRATLVTEEAVLAIMTAMNAFSSGVSSALVTPVKTGPMNAATPVDASARQSLGTHLDADQSFYRLFNR